MIDGSVIDAIRAAVEKDPENQALRLHLATLLFQNAQAADALQHCKHLLLQKPDDLQVLALARDCAMAANDPVSAERYGKIHFALSAQEPAPQNESGAQASASEPINELGGALRVVRGGVEPDGAIVESEKPTITLADVAGMEEVKRRLNLAFLAPLKNPAILNLYGKSLRGGLLLYGPPGCGKTYIARATAGELKAKFIPVGLSDVMDMWLGQSERNLHEIFELARRSQPCVLFFDEIDALGRKRSLMRHSSEHNIVNQLLAEMDSVQNNNEGVFVLAATNHPWDVDVALRRPGRLDRILLVLPPDRTAREAIVHLNLRGKPVEKDLDVAWIAGRTEDFSGADVAHLCDSAAEVAIEDSLKQNQARAITMSDFKKALKEVKSTARSWFEIAKNYALFANEGGLYDDLVDYLRMRKFL
ncbi:AAA family ATPase [bacterium]|nr:AAA family ATPase [bacterium]